MSSTRPPLNGGRTTQEINMNMHILNQWQDAFIFALAMFGSGLGALPGNTEEKEQRLDTG